MPRPWYDAKGSSSLAGLAYQPLSDLVGVLQVPREVLLAREPLLFLVEARHVVLGVIGYLQRIVARVMTYSFFRTFENRIAA